MIKQLTLIAALAIAPIAVNAGTQLLPPSEFDHPYDGPMTVIQVKRSNVHKECSRNGAVTMRFDVAGCARVVDGHCVIHLAMKTKRAAIGAILRHEVAHCNGWKH